MLSIPQSTTLRVPLQAYLSSDHVSAATGKTIAITISKNGAAYGNPNAGATNATEIANGSYYVDLGTADTGTTGPLFIRGAVATVDDVIAIYNVVKATNGGWTALPDTAATTNASLLTSGTGTDQLSVTSGRIDIGKALGTAVTLDANNVLNVSSKYWAGGLIPAPNVTGVPLVDDKYLLGTIYITPATAGIQDINVKNINNVAAATPGAVGGLFIAGTNAATTITTGLTTTFTGNLTGSVGSVSGAVGSVTARVTANTDQWNGTTVNGTIPPDTVFIRSGTAQAGAASSITLDASASAANNLYNGETVFIRSGAGAGQSAVITAYVGATKVATVSPAWATTPDSSSVFSILAMGPSATTVSGTVNANVVQWNSSNVVAPNVAGIPLVDLKYTLGTLSAGTAGYIAPDWGHINAPTTTVNLSGTTIKTATSLTTNNDKTGYSLTQTFPSNFSSLAITSGGAITVDGTSPFTESYAPQGSGLTLAQFAYGLTQQIGQMSIAGTIMTVKKRDGATTAKTYTLDSATSPTTISETT